MKKLVAMIAVLVAIMTVAMTAATAEIYPATMIVIDLDYENDLVVMRDGIHEDWIVTMEGIEDWMIGDLVSLIMEDSDTFDRSDDLIVDCWYAGFSVDANGMLTD